MDANDLHHETSSCRRVETLPVHKSQKWLVGVRKAGGIDKYLVGVRAGTIPTMFDGMDVHVVPSVPPVVRGS